MHYLNFINIPVKSQRKSKSDFMLYATSKSKRINYFRLLLEVAT